LFVIAPEPASPCKMAGKLGQQTLPTLNEAKIAHNSHALCLSDALAAVSSRRHVKETFARRHFESSILSAANSGVQFIVEKSCHDGFAKALASRRQSDFLRSVDYIDQARAAMNRDWEKRRTSQGAPNTSYVDQALAATKAAKAALPPLGSRGEKAARRNSSQ